jgi:hydroxyacyl-ACP dehydratase HTD2-like protein with hotdog domain
MPLLDQKTLEAIGRSESLGTLMVGREDIRKYSIATGQTSRKFLDGDEAPLLFFMSLPWRLDELVDLAVDGLPQDDLIPDFPLEKRMGGGMRVESTRSIIPGDVLSAERVLCEIYEKEGRSGPLIFHVVKIDIKDASDHVIIRGYDKRIVR